MRAVTFQSMPRTSSPGWYSRTSSNDEAGALERRVVLAAERVADEPAGPEVQAADLVEHVGREHGDWPRAGLVRRASSGILADTDPFPPAGAEIPMPRAATRPLPFKNVGELFDHLGGIPASRVCLDPPPGTATKRDLIRLHSNNGKLYELVHRTLVEKPMGAPEAFLAAELIRLFGRFLDTQDVGFLYAPDVLIELLPKLVRGPDVCFVPWSRRPEGTVPTKPISDLIPTLVVEVLSPSNTRGEMARKLGEYFLAGVELAWIIDPAARSAAAYTVPDAWTDLDAAGVLDGGDVLPGFRLPLTKLFQRLAAPSENERKDT